MAERDQQELLLSITSFLSKNNIPYMITGAWSVIYYARPRASHDIDFIVELYKEDVNRVTKAFKGLCQEYLVQAVAIQEAILKRDMFMVTHLPTMLKLDFWLLKKDDFDTLRFKRRKLVRLLNQEMSIATPEDTIIKKMLWYTSSHIEKHIVDAAFVYQVQKEDLDMTYLGKWVKKLNLQKYIRELEKIDLGEHM